MIALNKKGVFLLVVGILAVSGLLFAAFSRNSFEIFNTGSGPEVQKASNYPRSQLIGTPCENYNSRPFAFMVSSDKEARPLSGIGEADMVFEMPVVENGFTRMMAVYQCGRPKEVGSIRSSRLDFVPLALGLNAIYSHFGGEHEVLAQLNSGVIDNIDGLKYDEIYYYRKSGIARPHNSFTTFELMTKIAEKLGYKITDGKISYPHEEKSKSSGTAQPGPLFSDNFRVDWQYNQSSNSYLRSRSGTAEMDKNTGKQVEAKNVIVMKTTWSPINKDYIRVKTIGSGGALVYKNGTVISGTWEKKDDKAKLYFYDQNHREIQLVSGITWVEIITTMQ